MLQEYLQELFLEFLTKENRQPNTMLFDVYISQNCFFIEKNSIHKMKDYVWVVQVHL